MSIIKTKGEELSPSEVTNVINTLASILSQSNVTTFLDNDGVIVVKEKLLEYVKIL